MDVQKMISELYIFPNSPEWDDEIEEDPTWWVKRFLYMSVAKPTYAPIYDLYIDQYIYGVSEVEKFNLRLDFYIRRKMDLEIANTMARIIRQYRTPDAVEVDSSLIDSAFALLDETGWLMQAKPSRFRNLVTKQIVKIF